MFAQQEEFFQARQQFVHHTAVLGTRITRVDSRKFDGNAVTFIYAFSGRVFADGVDGLNVVVVITVGIFLGKGCFAQHVERIEIAHFFALFAVLQGFFDGLPGNELLAQQAHGVIHALADKRCAAFSQQAGQGRAQSVVIVRGGEFAGNQQAPCGGIDEQRRTIVQVAAPVAFGQFVLNKFVAGFGIGNTQQGFGQTHQCHALFTRQGEFVHQRIHAAGFGAVGTHLCNEAARQFVGVFTFFVAHLGALQHILHGLDFVAAVGIGNSLAQWGLVGKGKIEHFRFSKRFR